MSQRIKTFKREIFSILMDSKQEPRRREFGDGGV
jgi:hypothetical protein